MWHILGTFHLYLILSWIIAPSGCGDKTEVVYLRSLKTSPSSQTPESLLFFAKYSSVHIYGYIKELNFLTVSTCYLIKILENWIPYLLSYPLIDVDTFKFLSDDSAGPQIFGFSSFF